MIIVVEKSQKGFAPIIILIIMVVAAVGTGAFFLGRKSTPISQPLPQVSQPSASANPQAQGNQMSSDGVQNDQTYLTFSTDGKTWQSGTLVAEHASVPDIIQLKSDVGSYKKDDLLIYYVDFAQFSTPGSETIAVISSSDKGKTWSPKKKITISNKPNKGAAVDPAIVQLGDGKLRLYFFGSEISAGNPGQAAGPHKVYSATSSDGVNFLTEDGVRFSDNNLTDPEVINYSNNWYMYYSLGTSFKLVTSTDGLNFTPKNVSGNDTGGVPGAVGVNGGVRVFTCGKGLGETFAPNGTNFTLEKSDIFGGSVTGAVCDPSVIALSDGTFAMAYKIGHPGGGMQQSNQQMPPNNNFNHPMQRQPSY